MKRLTVVRSLSGLATICMLLTTSMASAGILKDEKGLAWASKRDLTSAQFSAAFKDYRDRGYMMIDVDAYPTRGGLRYAMIWRDNTDGRGWAEHRDMSSAAYHDKWQNYKEMGYRPLDVESYRKGSQQRWAGIWVENREGFSWSSHRGLTSAEYGDLFQRKRDAGFRLVDVEVYSTAAGLRYACIWYENVDHRPWAQLRGLTREEYQREVTTRSRQGFRVVDYESYETSNGQRYAAIWEKKDGFAWQTRTNRTRQQFANLWRQYRDQGYRLVDFERYSTASGDRYAGIWAENASRFQYSRKLDLDRKITQYRKDNDLPGISVAVVHDGNMLYSRGFGSADIDNNRVAHSRTIYNAASVSKVIGGTLAAKLEDELVLSNGNSFYLDLVGATSDYISGLPAHHTHTIEQLLSHTGCVAQYTTSPAIPNQTTHYPTATAAVESIEDTALVNGCNVGSTFSYSTPAFTFAGAALEQATGQSIKNLLENEIFEPYGLQDTRVQFSSSQLPANYDRATPYDNSNMESSYQNNSWKVLGGGIETSAWDLARFGWKVLNGNILSVNARDNRLWQRVVPGVSDFGLGWKLTTDNNGRRVAEWNGFWKGSSRSYLRVYRDENLVIAVMSNRSNHSVRDVWDLSDELADVILH